jgi:carbonic anhydrase/acetyltransferase-like protein (isoleucine patch superfamily)
MGIYALGDKIPDIHPDAYVHPDATIIGEVTLGAESTVWPQAVLRGDYGHIRIGARTSIQDGSVIHVPGMIAGTVIGDDCLIGSGSIVLHRVVVHRNAVVGANAVVTNGTIVPSGAIALGVPAVVKEGVVKEGHVDLPVSVYVSNGKHYAAELRRID